MKRLRAQATRRNCVRATFGLVAAVVLVASACDATPKSGANDSARAAGASPLSPTSAPSMGAAAWNADAGPFLVLPTVDGGVNAGSLLRPDATELNVGDTTGLGAMRGNGQLDLFARGGKVGLATLSIERAASVEQGCTAWPVARLAIGTQTSMPWTAAFLAGRVTAIQLDSIEGLSPRDSARLVVDLTRMASALRDDTVATFHGLPFVVLRAWRTKGLSPEFVVATLARRVNQEDSPKEERLVMVVDQTGTDSRQWTIAWHERASGREEELVVAEPLLAYRTSRGSDVHLLFGRDDGDALGAAILTRTATGWRVLWESAVAGCD